MLRHSKSVMSMIFVCFDIAKLECQKLNIIGYFFSISYMFMHDLLKKKICKEKKNQKDQNALNTIASCILEDVGVIGCTSKVIVSIKQLLLCVS